MLTPNQINLLMDLRESVAKESGLITHALFDGENVCTIGSLIPPAERGGSNVVKKLLKERYDITCWEWESRFDSVRSLIREIVIYNDAFDGSLEERRNHMLAWIEEKLSDQLAKEVTKEPLTA